MQIKLVIVDDEVDVCDYAKSFFEERGLKVFTSLDGEGALEIVKKNKPHIMLLDVKMKGIDGIEVLKKAKEIRPEIEIIMVTAVEDEGKIAEAKSLGARDYVTKPLVLDELESTVCSLADQLGAKSRS